MNLTSQFAPLSISFFCRKDRGEVLDLPSLSFGKKRSIFETKKLMLILMQNNLVILYQICWF